MGVWIIFVAGMGWGVAGVLARRVAAGVSFASNAWGACWGPFLLPLELAEDHPLAGLGVPQPFLLVGVVGPVHPAGGA